MFKKKNKENNEERIAEAPAEAGAEIIEEPKKQRDASPANLKELIEKNIKWSQVVYNQNKQIKRRLTMIVALAWLKAFLIMVPVVLGVIYLPPLLKDLLSQYGGLLSGVASGGGMGNLDNILNQLSPEQVQEGLKLLQR